VNHHLARSAAKSPPSPMPRGDPDGALAPGRGLVGADNITLVEMPPYRPESPISRAGFGTICAVTGSPNRYFPAWRTSWMPGEMAGLEPIATTRPVRFALEPSLGLRLRPLCRGCTKPWPCDRAYHSGPEISGRSGLDHSLALIGLADVLRPSTVFWASEPSREAQVGAQWRHPVLDL